MYKKIRFASDTLKRIDGDYSQKGSDVRVAELNPSEYEISFVYEKGLNVQQIGEKHNADIAINFPYMYDGTLVIGKSVIDGKLHTDDWDITKPRYGFGIKDKPYIGPYKEGSESYAKGNPLLVENRKVVVDERLKIEQTNDNIKNGRDTRMGIGLKDGNVLLAFVDGYTPQDKYKYDQGMTLQEFGKAMQSLGCDIFDAGDGGGSVTLYIKGEGIVNAIKYGTPRVVNHAIIFKKKHDPNNPFDDYRITSPYGWRISPINGGKEFHTGIDLAKAHKSPIYSFTEGEVIFAGEGLRGSGFGGYGNVVAVKDGKGYLHCYCHLDSVSVEKGTFLNRGVEVGKQGKTGQVTGSHLHYEVRKKDSPYYGWISDAENRCFNPTVYLVEYFKGNDLNKENAQLKLKIVDLENKIQTLTNENYVLKKDKSKLERITKIIQE